MGASDKAAYFRVDIEGNVRQFAADGSDAMKELAQKITDSQTVVKQLSSANRNLKGTSEEVTNAKAKLAAAIENEQRQISKANAGLLAQGVAYERLIQDQRNAEREADKLAKKQEAATNKEALKELIAMRGALSSIGGPMGEIVGKFETFGKVAEGAGTATGRFKIAAIATTASVLALTAATIGATMALGGWILRSADLNRSQQLVREAMAGSASNAANLGTQVAALAAKVITPTAELNSMATELLNIGLNGREAVDSMNTIAQASAAAGPKVGAAIEEWITRGARWQRMSLNPLEMRGTGLKFQDVAAEYAKQTGLGIDRARIQLVTGMAKLEPAAAALRKVVEKQFAQINARKMLELDTIATTFGKHLQTLSTGVDFEPIAKGLGEIMDQFDAGTVTGQGMQTVATNLGKAMSDVFVGEVPTIKGFVQSLVIGALEAELAFFTMRNAIRHSFAGDIVKQIDPFKVAIQGIEVVTAAAALAMASFAVSSAAVWGPFALAATNITLTINAIRELVGLIRDTDWRNLGGSVSHGLADSIKAGTPQVVQAAETMMTSSNQAASSAIEAHSPSKVYERLGKSAGEGFEGGIEKSTPGAKDAAAELVGPAGGGGGGSGGGLGSGARFELHIHVDGNKHAAENVSALSSPSFHSQFMHAIEMLAASAGIATQAAVTP